MEQGELVRNTRENEFPYRSEYELAPAAKELLAVVVPVAEWAESNATLLKRVQQRRHAEGTGNG
ncbi:winged helix-turn-helix transcriptional regulator [Streptomyces sp. MBT62]|nr:winged helix-turn-helix transcriptional regulator [Streptomyces sp. MBT62]